MRACLTYTYKFGDAGQLAPLLISCLARFHCLYSQLGLHVSRQELLCGLRSLIAESQLHSDVSRIRLQLRSPEGNAHEVDVLKSPCRLARPTFWLITVTVKLLFVPFRQFIAAAFELCCGHAASSSPVGSITYPRLQNPKFAAPLLIL